MACLRADNVIEFGSLSKPSRDPTPNASNPSFAAQVRSLSGSYARVGRRTIAAVAMDTEGRPVAVELASSNGRLHLPL